MISLYNKNIAQLKIEIKYILNILYYFNLFFHTDQMASKQPICFYGPNCFKKNKGCPKTHSIPLQCRNSDCTNENCVFQHPAKPAAVSIEEPSRVEAQDDEFVVPDYCPDGDSCEDADCPMKHPCEASDENDEEIDDELDIDEKDEDAFFEEKGRTFFPDKQGPSEGRPRFYNPESGEYL